MGSQALSRNWEGRRGVGYCVAAYCCITPTHFTLSDFDFGFALVIQRTGLLFLIVLKLVRSALATIKRHLLTKPSNLNSNRVTGGITGHWRSWTSGRLETSSAWLTTSAVSGRCSDTGTRSQSPPHPRLQR